MLKMCVFTNYIRDFTIYPAESIDSIFVSYKMALYLRVCCLINCVSDTLYVHHGSIISWIKIMYVIANVRHSAASFMSNLIWHDRGNWEYRSRWCDTMQYDTMRYDTIRWIALRYVYVRSTTISAMFTILHGSAVRYTNIHIWVESFCRIITAHNFV